MKYGIWNLKSEITIHQKLKTKYQRLFTNDCRHHSTIVENVRQINLFLQNKPNFRPFRPENEDFTEKQTQYKPNSKPILAQKSGGQSQTKPIQTQFYPRFQLTLLWSLPSVVLTCYSAGGRGSNPKKACPRLVLSCFSVGGPKMNINTHDTMIYTKNTAFRQNINKPNLHSCRKTSIDKRVLNQSLTAINTIANLFFMTCPLNISATADYKKQSEVKHLPPILRIRSTVLYLLSSAFCLLSSALLTGCPPQEEEPIWNNLKIGDLAPRREGKQQTSRLVESTNFNLYIFEMPSDKIDKLDEIRKTLFTRNLRYQSAHSFAANSFSVQFGQIRMWRELFASITAVGAKEINKVSLMLTDDTPETIAITRIESPQTIFFTSTYGSREAANVGPGILALRIKTQKIPALRGVCNFTAYPVYSPPMIKSTIPVLDARTQRREFAFSTAAFGLRMGPGDFILLGPKEYVSDQTALGGLFFCNPEGNLFFSETERSSLEHKPSVRLFLLFCTRTSY
jgi:hypothetical protein